MRRRVGVVGATDEDECVGRVGDAGRWGEGGVTSLWRIELNMALACSVATRQCVGSYRKEFYGQNQKWIEWE